MTHAAASTISVLCYDDRQNVDFADLTANALKLMKCKPGICCKTIAHYDDLFVCDWGDMRIGFAYCNGADGFDGHDDLAGYEESLMVIVSAQPDQIYGGPDAEMRQRICCALTDRLERILPATEALLIDLPTPFTTHVYDQIVENLWPALAGGHASEEMIEFFITQAA